MRFVVEDFKHWVTNKDIEKVYHNTSYENVDNILKNGLLQSKSVSEPGYQMIWTTTTPKDYGGCTIEITIPDGITLEHVNDNEYLVYDDIPARYLKLIDFPVISNTHSYKDLDKLIDRYGKDKVKKVITKQPSYIGLDNIKRLTPELDW